MTTTKYVLEGREGNTWVLIGGPYDSQAMALAAAIITGLPAELVRIRPAVDFGAS